MSTDLARIRARQLRRRMTDAEKLLWFHLRNRQFSHYKFRRQFPIAGFFADFVCYQAKLVIECDGGQHIENSVYDYRRTQTFSSFGFLTLRYWNHDVLLRTEQVLDDIHRHLLLRP